MLQYSLIVIKKILRNGDKMKNGKNIIKQILFR